MVYRKESKNRPNLLKPQSAVEGTFTSHVELDFEFLAALGLF